MCFMLYSVLIIVTYYSDAFFLICNIFFYTQLDFVYHFLREFYIFNDHIFAFFLFLLWKDFDIFHCTFFVVFLYYLDESFDVFIYVKKIAARVLYTLHFNFILIYIIHNISLSPEIIRITVKIISLYIYLRSYNRLLFKNK